MQIIQPQIKELQKKYKSDRGKLQEETMKLYRSTASTRSPRVCPLILQLPVFIGLYAAIKGIGPLLAPAYQPSVQAAQPCQLPVDPAPRQPGSRTTSCSSCTWSRR